MADIERRRRRVRHEPPDAADGRVPRDTVFDSRGGATPDQPNQGGTAPGRTTRGRAAPDRPSRDGAAPDQAIAETTPVHDPEVEPVPIARDRPVPTARAATAADSHPVEDRDTERGLRGLVGAGSSQVKASAAMRARDAARPTEADLATAASDLVIIRRGWVPRDPLTPR